MTGAAAGIGAACAKRLAADGMSVGVLDLDAARCAGTVEAITAMGGVARALGGDISKRDAVQAAIAECRRTLGPDREHLLLRRADGQSRHGGLFRFYSSASKGAVVALTRSLAQELAPRCQRNAALFGAV